jgi:hypothetical protein
MSKEYNKKYYESNKEKNKSKVNEKVRCESCDKEVSRSNFANHCQSKKHKVGLLNEYDWLSKMKNKESFAKSIDLIVADMNRLKETYEQCGK